MSNMSFTIGADPELFVTNSEGKYKSVIGMIGGTKDAPKILTSRGHAVLEDNVAAEFNIPPCNSFAEFKKEIQFTLEKISEILTGLSFSQESAVSFPEEELNCQDAWIFGCEPDFNAWSGMENDKPCASDINLRSAGGHVHVGTDLDKRSVIQAMDFYLGVPSVYMDNGQLRRNLYGKAGAYRPKPYGAEYRTLSNFWIFKSELIEWVYTGTQKALEFVSNGRSFTKQQAEDIQTAINTSNVALAHKLSTGV
jgi:hypothetical protein